MCTTSMWGLVKKEYIWEKNLKEKEKSMTVEKHIPNVVLINLAVQRKSQWQFSWHVQSHYAPHETGDNTFSTCYCDYALDCHFSTSVQLYSGAFMLWRQQRMRNKNDISEGQIRPLKTQPCFFSKYGANKQDKYNFARWN